MEEILSPPSPNVVHLSEVALHRDPSDSPSPQGATTKLWKTTQTGEAAKPRPAARLNKLIHHREQRNVPHGVVWCQAVVLLQNKACELFSVPALEINAFPIGVRRRRVGWVVALLEPVVAQEAPNV
ncbi:hypothetical protein MHYP_G00168120 [Metynnis hypsauchen]